MLTKEEYIDIIEFLDFFYGDNLINTVELRKEKSKELQKEDLENFKHKLDELLQLINEHFDNPPLEFLDIEEGDWIWNNASKEYIKVLNRYIHQGKGMLVVKNHLRNHPEEIRFVEGRFYRKQVQENEME